MADPIFSGKSNSQGFEDPNSEYPKSHNWWKPVFGDEVEELEIGGGKPGFPLDVPDTGASRYGYAHKLKTETGHTLVFDDTEENKRILIKHSEGAGIELKPDGSVVILAKANVVTVGGGDQTVIIEGEGKMSFGGLKIEVEGDMNIDVKGTYSLKAKKKVENIDESVISTYGTYTQTINGAYTNLTTGLITETHLAGTTRYVKGKNQTYTEGDLVFANTGDMQVSSDDITVAGDNINIIGEDITVFGDTGMIGGSNVEYKGKSMTATTFHGDLNGTAVRANASSAQNYPSTSTFGSAYDFTNEAATRDPLTPEDVDTFLKESEKGIRKIAVDPGDYFKDLVDKTKETGGVSKTSLNVEQYRSKFRDPANLSNSDLVGNSIADNVVSSNLASTVPPAIGRIKDGGITPKFGWTNIGNITKGSKSGLIFPKKLSDNIVPDPQFNPDLKTTFSANTLMAPGVPLSRFFGGNDSISFNVNDLSTDLKRNLYYHAEVLSSFNNRHFNGLFNGLKLVISEGVYRAGPEEKITPNSLNDLASKGRCIFYRLYDKNGRLANEKMFDLAEYWKDTIRYDKLILDYDSYSISDYDEIVITSQVGVVIPQIPESYKTVFNRAVETRYNNLLFRADELVEILKDPITNAPKEKLPVRSTAKCPMTPPSEYTGVNGNLPKGSLVSIGNGHKLQKDAARAYLAMEAAAKKDGIVWSITDSYRSYAAQYDVAQRKGLYSEGGLAACPGRSNHGLGKAVDLGNGANRTGTPQNNWLVNNAYKFGFYTIPREPWHWEYRG